MMKSQKQGFFHGSLILLLSAVIAKALGAVFKIPLTNCLGGVGMGYFSCAYGLFLPVYAFAITGISTAVSALVARECGCGREKNAERIHTAARRLFLAAGCLLSAGIWWLAEPFVRWTAAEPAAVYAVKMIAPAAFFGCYAAAERGYYEGKCNMYPTAISQAVEAIAKVVLGLWCSGWVLSHPAELRQLLPGCAEPLPLAAAAGILGVTLSTAAGSLYLWLRYVFGWKRRSSLRKQNTPTERFSVICRQLLKILLPVAVGSVVTNLTSVIDLCTMMRSLRQLQQTHSAELRAIFGEIAAASEFPTWLYGIFTGMTLTIFNLIPSVTNMLGKSVLPCAAQAWAKKQPHKVAGQTASVLYLTAAIAFPAAGGLLMVAEPVMRLLYGKTDGVQAAAVALQSLLPGMVCLCLTMPLFSVLQGIGRADLPVKYLLPCVGMKLAGNLVFLKIPLFSVTGAGFSTDICYAALLVLSVLGVQKQLGERLHIVRLVLPLGYAALMSMGAAYLCFGWLKAMPLPAAMAGTIAGAGAVYFVVLVLLGKPLADLRNGMENSICSF